MNDLESILIKVEYRTAFIHDNFPVQPILGFKVLQNSILTKVF